MDVKFPYDVRILLQNTCLMQQKKTMGWNSVVSFLHLMKTTRRWLACRKGVESDQGKMEKKKRGKLTFTSSLSRRVLEFLRELLVLRNMSYFLMNKKKSTFYTLIHWLVGEFTVTLQIILLLSFVVTAAKTWLVSVGKGFISYHVMTLECCYLWWFYLDFK